MIDEAPPELQILQDVLNEIGRAAIAVSGGVDSMTLAIVAGRLPGNEIEVFHALSPAVPADASVRVRQHAEQEAWRLHEINAGEFDDPKYRDNPVNRCFYCKSNLYGTIASHTTETVLPAQIWMISAITAPGSKRRTATACDTPSLRRKSTRIQCAPSPAI